MHPTVRPAHAQDLDGLGALFLELFTFMAQGRPDLFRTPDAQDPAERARVRAFCADLLASADDQLLVAVEGEQLLGLVHVWLRRVPEASTVPFRRACVEGWIQHLVVASHCRKQGVGRALNEAARAWAHEKGADSMGLQVWAFNERGRQFFERLGYAPRSVQLYDR